MERNIARVNKVTKWGYNHLCHSNRATHITKYYWDRFFDINDKEWQVIFSNCFIAVRETKIHYFQFKFIHKILSVNSYLHKLKILDNDLYSFCGNDSGNAQAFYFDHVRFHLSFGMTFLLIL